MMDKMRGNIDEVIDVALPLVNIASGVLSNRVNSAGIAIREPEQARL